MLSTQSSPNDSMIPINGSFPLKLRAIDVQELFGPLHIASTRARLSLDPAPDTEPFSGRWSALYGPEELDHILLNGTLIERNAHQNLISESLSRLTHRVRPAPSGHTHGYYIRNIQFCKTVCEYGRNKGSLLICNAKPVTASNNVAQRRLRQRLPQKDFCCAPVPVSKGGEQQVRQLEQLHSSIFI